MSQEEAQLLLERVARLENIINEFYRPDSYRFPRPVTNLSGRATAITQPTAPSATYQQSEAVSAVTAINAIRTALTNIGITF